MHLLLVKIFFCLLLFGCSKFEYNPYQSETEGLPENLNALNLQKLRDAPADDTITILFTGDSQRFYESLDKFVAKANSIPSVDMVIISGDITDFGLAQEFLWICERLSLLNAPYFCVIGNHDLTGNGSTLYKKVFGPDNFAFNYSKYKFLFHNTNGLEYAFNGAVPDMNWLTEEMNDATADYLIGVSHVPPYHADFDPALSQPYQVLLGSDPRFILSLNGHLHNGGESYYYDDHVLYLQSFSLNHDKCLLLKLNSGKLTKTEIHF